MGRVGSNERQRDFVKEYQRIGLRHSRHEVWQDFVWMAAAAISNACDKRHAEKREQRYMDIIRKYTPEEQDVFPTLFALLVTGMEEWPDQDFMGELYMELNLGNDDAGQFFTPYDVCKAMAEMCMDEGVIRTSLERHGYISINDPACGAGATLVAAAMSLKDRGINYQQQAIFIGQDIDYTVGLMCYIQLSLLGCAGYVHIGNTLTDPMTGHVLFGDGKDSTWYTPIYFTEAWSARRAAESMRAIFRRVDELTSTKPAQDPPPEPEKPEEVTAPEPPQAPPEPEPEPPQEPPQEPPANVPTITISKKKKNAGQLMFDFG